MSKSIFTKKLFWLKAIYISVLISHIMISQVFTFSLNYIEKMRTILGLFFMVLGIAIIFVQFLKTNRYFFAINNKYLFIYLIFSLFVCINNYQYGILNNLKSLIWTSIHFFIIFSFSYECPYDKEKKIFKRIFVLPMIIWTITGLYSFFQFLFQISYNINGRAQGWYYNRLFGIYKDPNFSSIASLCVIFMSLYICTNSKKIFYKFLCVIAIAVQTIYILLAHSRGGWISGLIGLFTYLWVWNGRRIYKKILKFLVTFIQCITVIIVLIQLNVLLSFLPPLLSQTLPTAKVVLQSQEASKEQATASINMDRTDLQDKDISNGRIKRWQLILGIYPDKPFIGISPQNLKSYVKTNYPIIYKNKSFGDLHNGYLAVLMGTGMIGAIIILLFILQMLHKFHAIYIKDYGSYLYASFAGIIVVVAVSAMIIQEIFWINSVGTILFWLSLGKLNVLYPGVKGRER